MPVSSRRRSRGADDLGPRHRRSTSSSTPYAAATGAHDLGPLRTSLPKSNGQLDAEIQQICYAHGAHDLGPKRRG
jgi:hypothetical protein